MSLLSKVPPIGQKRQAEMLKSATSLTYMETPQGPLQCHFFGPDDFEPGQRRRPLVIFLHGGFWDGSMPTQFVPQCLHFASRGAIAVAVETRVESTHGTGPMECLEDLQTILNWLNERSEDFGIDLEKVVIGGASGGAFLALQKVLPKDAGESSAIHPAALLLFSSVLDTTRPEHLKRFPDKKTAKKLSPLRSIRKGLPPMILFHGKQDRVTPYADAEKFARVVKRKRNKVELIDFDKAEHPFFNFNVSELYYELTLKAADRFLVAHGILPEEDPAMELS
ncbi:alpha/beta hydrolase [Haloferula chungangensis]|uniref:Alpha/beta hydrolase n=1 Tax=Haloferula chungangensis TaxID=1048331 RepID=A0ABW2L3W9_9BACT